MKFTKGKSFVLGILFSLIGFVSAHAGDDFYGHHDMMGWYGTGMWGMGWFGWIISLLVIAVLVLLIILLSKKIKEADKKRK